MIEKYILLSLTYLVGIGELILAIFFWVTRSGNEIRKVMALLAFSTGAWVITSAISSYRAQTPLTTFDTSLIFVFGVFLLSSLLHLVVIYPYPIYRFDWLHLVLFYTPATLFSVAAFIPKLILAGFTGGPQNPGVIFPGPLYNLYNVYLLVLFVIVVAVLINRRKNSTGRIEEMSE